MYTHIFDKSAAPRNIHTQIYSVPPRSVGNICSWFIYLKASGHTSCTRVRSFHIMNIAYIHHTISMARGVWPRTNTLAQTAEHPAERRAFACSHASRQNKTGRSYARSQMSKKCVYSILYRAHASHTHTQIIHIYWWRGGGGGGDGCASAGSVCVCVVVRQGIALPTHRAHSIASSTASSSSFTFYVEQIFQHYCKRA